MLMGDMNHSTKTVFNTFPGIPLIPNLSTVSAGAPCPHQPRRYTWQDHGKFLTTQAHDHSYRIGAEGERAALVH